MTGPQHYATAERLLQHAATMLDVNVDADRTPSSSSGRSQWQRSAKSLLCWRPRPRSGSAPAWDHLTSGNGGMLPQHGQRDHLAEPPADLARVCGPLCTGDNRRWIPSEVWLGRNAREPNRQINLTVRNRQIKLTT
jgi:hypothetical protein